MRRLLPGGAYSATQPHTMSRVHLLRLQPWHHLFLFQLLRLHLRLLLVPSATNLASCMYRC